MTVQRALIVVLLIATSCSREKPEYDLGFEDGCEVGKADAYGCQAKNPKVGTLEDKESEYSNGFFDGYADCYEAATVLSTCNNWEAQDSGR